VGAQSFKVIRGFRTVEALSGTSLRDVVDTCVCEHSQTSRLQLVNTGLRRQSAHISIEVVDATDARVDITETYIAPPGIWSHSVPMGVGAQSFKVIRGFRTVVGAVGPAAGEVATGAVGAFLHCCVCWVAVDALQGMVRVQSGDITETYIAPPGIWSHSVPMGVGAQSFNFHIVGAVGPAAGEVATGAVGAFLHCCVCWVAVDALSPLSPPTKQVRDCPSDS
jgi:hypothetical protein